MNIGNDKKIILATVLLFLVSSAYLAWAETRQADFNLGKNWWILAFADPKSDSLSFAIENHSGKNSFHYVVSNGTGRISEGDVNVSRGGTKNINLDNVVTAGKVTVQVSDGTDKKEIYKNF